MDRPYRRDHRIRRNAFAQPKRCVRPNRRISAARNQRSHASGERSSARTITRDSAISIEKSPHSNAIRMAASNSSLSSIPLILALTCTDS
jgi:hypothetical protein